MTFTPNRDSELTELDASLGRRFHVVESVVDVAGRQLSIAHPASAEELISEADFEVDERLPYWAELWPSARILGAHLLGMQGEGRSLLELGCGSGLVSTCASLAGFRVCATDYYDDALSFARLNALRNGTRIDTRIIDWRRMPEDLGRFDVVVASDVLYERPYGELVARAIAATLASDGRALIADPGRVGREDFVTAARAANLEVVDRRSVPHVDGKIRQTIDLFTIRRSSR